MAREVQEQLITSPGGLYLDCTLGGGGHSRAILQRLDASGRLLALDWDEDAHTFQRMEDTVLGRDPRVSLLRLSFGELDRLPGEWADARFDGILMDLGLSSHQVDTPERGFAYLHDGPLDMRMDRRATCDAATLLAEIDELELGRILRDLGELSQWRRLARLLVEARQRTALERTGQVKDLVEDQLGRQGSYAILSRLFQALRIAVNDELGALERGLDGSFARLKPKARLAVITYHSLEDRVVKTRFRHWSGEGASANRNLPMPAGPPRLARLLQRRGVVPAAAEIERNPRSRSARLRLLERVEA